MSNQDVITKPLVELSSWDLDSDQADMDQLRSTLSADERQRAERFHFDIHRRRFVVGRARMRAKLGRLLDVAAPDVPIVTMVRGKPAIDPAAGSDVRFNLAHSGRVALMAVTRGREVGVDVERIRPGFADSAIAEHFFAPGEVSALRSLPQASQQAAFFRCWTRKEAYLKGKGGGLSIPLEDFEVSLAPEVDGNALLWSRHPSGDESRWMVIDVSHFFAGLQAAIAVEGQDSVDVRATVAVIPEGAEP